MMFRLAIVALASVVLTTPVLAQYQKPVSPEKELARKAQKPDSTHKSGYSRTESGKKRNTDSPDFLGAPAVVVEPGRR